MHCQCCKEIGHTMNECPRDPNIKTGCVNANDDNNRIKNIKDNKKLFSETALTTTHFLKKCI